MAFVWEVSETKQQEGFGDAFLHAVAAAAGCTTAKPAIDDDSIDWTLSCKLAPRRPKLDVQMKSTADAGDANFIPYAVRRKAYDDLSAETLVPRLLIVVVVPPDVGDWLTLGPQELVLRHCAYWHSLRGAPATANATSVTVQISKQNTFDVDFLQSAMNRINDGRPL